MTNEEVLAAAKLMIDYAALDPAASEVWVTSDAWCSLLEYRVRDGAWKLWNETIPLWDWYRYEYRRQLTPKLRPYTGEELAGMIGAEVKAVDRVFFISVVSLRLDCVPKIVLTRTESGFSERSGNPEWLLDHYTHIDGSPCGKEVK